MTETKERAPEGRAATDVTRPLPTGFRAFRDELDRMFHAMSLPEMNWRSGFPGLAEGIGLRVDVSETDGEIQVTGELPGVEEKDVEVVLDGDMLRIRAEKHSESERKDEDRTWHVVERSYGTLERAIRVPAGIDPDSVKAKFAKGVLTVTLPKPSDANPTARKIAISAN